MIKEYITSAFGKNNTGGKAAGMALFHPELERKQKRAIAKKLNLTETVFSESSEQADFALDYFAPQEKVPLYGIAEEASAGTSCCALAGYPAKYKKKKDGYLYEQGYPLQQVSGILINGRYRGEETDRILVEEDEYLVEERYVGKEKFDAVSE